MPRNILLSVFALFVTLSASAQQNANPAVLWPICLRISAKMLTPIRAV